MTDHDLVARVAAVLADPPAGPPDSFVLHAALELGARHDLLPHVRPEGRPLARQRIEELGAAYAALERVEAPSGVPPEPVELVVPEVVLPSLAAAGHGIIALDRLHRVGPGDPVGTAGVRLLARELAANPTWNITWYRSRDLPAVDADGPGLVDVLLEPPSPGSEHTGFIFPTVRGVEDVGLPAALLAGPLASTAPERAGRDLLRVAAWSMLQDDPDAAPYGWTHCLTLPLAALGMAGRVARSSDALAVAATYVLAFRATRGKVRIDPTSPPPLRTAGAERAALVADLCTFAAGHHDAHMVKYTDACLRAARLDPEAADLYLSAAAHLADLWRAAEPSSPPGDAVAARFP